MVKKVSRRRLKQELRKLEAIKARVEVAKRKRIEAILAGVAQLAVKRAAQTRLPSEALARLQASSKEQRLPQT